MVRDFLLGCAWGLVLGCSSEAPGADAGTDALIGPDTPYEAAAIDAETPDAGQDTGPVDSSAGDERVWCEHFASVLPDANIPVACTGSNWSWTDVKGNPQGPCSSVVCPAMHGYECKFGGAFGAVCCPGFSCQ